ncbi:MAG: hypothetical protein FJ213_03825 [Ignavibacteria bacterium]|nr:hypothetical protein [Ignavibacteria bacterium]
MHFRKMVSIKFACTTLFLSIAICNSIVLAQPQTSKISSAPGSFSRMGFGSRGIGMGNAMTSVTEGQLSSYYNPALVVFQKGNNANLGYTFLSLDRRMNFLSVGRSFKFYKKDEDGNSTNEVHSTAGVSVGVINSGVGNIDGRDGSGLKTETYSTSENQFFLSFGIKPSERVAIGLTAKMYYYSLFEKMSSTSLGFDFGAIIKIMDELYISAVIADLNSKYQWDSTPIYKEKGRSNTIDKFPLLKRIGISYLLPNNLGIVAVDFESSNFGTNILKFGAEYNLLDYLKLRAGLDRFNLSNSDMVPKTSFGFQLDQSIWNLEFALNYAFVMEAYSPFDEHVISLGINF